MNLAGIIMAVGVFVILVIIGQPILEEAIADLLSEFDQLKELSYGE